MNKNTMYSLPIPTDGLNNLKAQAKAVGLPTTAYIRLLLAPHFNTTTPIDISVNRAAQLNTQAQATANPIQQTPVPRVQKPARDLAEELDSLFDS